MRRQCRRESGAALAVFAAWLAKEHVGVLAIVDLVEGELTYDIVDPRRGLLPESSHPRAERERHQQLCMRWCKRVHKHEDP